MAQKQPRTKDAKLREQARRRVAERKRKRADPMDAIDPIDGKRRCTAHNRSGARCRRAPILGGTVCDRHGGKAPQTKKAARQRLAEMVDPALNELEELLTMRKESPAVVLGAVNTILDRAGYKPTDRVALTALVGATPLDPENLRRMSDEDLVTLRRLNRLAMGMKDDD